MECIKFDISGKTAFFKNPQINTVNLSYGNIHKPMILGILGAIMGYKGRSQYIADNKLEYYDLLKDIKVAIQPHYYYWSKNIQFTTNTTGFANKGADGGATQIIKEQWLCDVKWTIYLCKDKVKDDVWENLKNSLLNNECEYDIYLGRRCHRARMNNLEVVNVKCVGEDEEIDRINTLVDYNEVIDLDSEVTYEGNEFDKAFYVSEHLPVELDEKTRYVMRRLLFTNYEIYEVKNKNNFYRYKDNILFFM